MDPYDIAAVLDRVGTYKKGPKAKPIPDVNELKDVYDILCQRLGYASSIRLRRILEWLFTPLEAEILHVLARALEDLWGQLCDGANAKGSHLIAPSQFLPGAETNDSSFTIICCLSGCFFVCRLREDGKP